MNIQWYPGHMTKTRRLIDENLKMVDVVVEILDARLPLASRNRDFDVILKQKPRVVVINKIDLADQHVTKRWKEYFNSQGIGVLCVNSLGGQGVREIQGVIKTVLAEKIQRDKAKGVNRSVKLMIVGIPNVGKSSFINRLTGKASTKVGDRPGVTRGKQWIRVLDDMELLDTPGILMPKFNDQDIAKMLAFTGAIKDDILDVEELCMHLCDFLRDNYPEMICQRYKIDNVEDILGLTGYELMELIGKKRGFIISGGEIDTLRCANVILDEFRGGKIGRISLESPKL